MRRPVVAFCVMVLSLTVAGPAWALITPEPVITAGGSQWEPQGNAAYVAYYSNTPGNRNDWNAYARERAGGAITQLNPGTTDGYVGNFDPGTNTVIYQQVNRRYTTSDIYTYDLDDGTRSPFPGLGTRRWEWSPRLSTSYVMFIRNERHAGRWKHVVYVRHRMSGDTTVLGRYPIEVSMAATSVGESYATWFVCQRTCKVFVRDLVGGTTTKVPAPNDKPQYGPTLDETAGNLYFVRSGFGCGKQVGIWQVPLSDLGATATKLAAMPGGVEADYLAVVPNPDTLVNDLMFTRYTCGRSADIWALPGVS